MMAARVVGRSFLHSSVGSKALVCRPCVSISRVGSRIKYLARKEPLDSPAFFFSSNNAAGSEPNQMIRGLDGMNAAQLKAICKEAGVKVSGKKAELKERLVDYFRNLSTNKEGEETTDNLDEMTVAELKARCKERGLKVSGKKADLKERLKDHFPSKPAVNRDTTKESEQPEDDSLDSMTELADLKELLKDHKPSKPAVNRDTTKESEHPEDDSFDSMTELADLKERLKDHMPSKPAMNRDTKESEQPEDDCFDSMTENDLRDALVARGMSRKGTRDELLERLKADVALAIKSSPPKDGRFGSHLNANRSPNNHQGISESLHNNDIQRRFFSQRRKFKPHGDDDDDDDWEVPQSVHIPVEKIDLSFIRSSGAGGQNVNKLSTKVDLRFHVLDAGWLPLEVRERLYQQQRNKINKKGVLSVQSQEFRTQEKNRNSAVLKLEDMVLEAWPRPKEREQWVGVSEESKERNKVNKKRRSSVKKNRRVSSHDW